MARVRMVLQFGETQAFEPFDRQGHAREIQGKSLGQLLDEFARLRSENLAELRALNLRQEDLERRGRHPALGVVTLSELLATWAAHDHRLASGFDHPRTNRCWRRNLGYRMRSAFRSK